MNVKTIRHYTVFLVALALCLGLALWPAAAQSHVRVGASLFTRADSNPAVLGVDEPTFRIVLLPLDLTSANNAWGVAALARSFGEELTDAAKDELVAALPEDGLFLRAGTWTAADLGVRGFSARLAVRTVATGNLAPDVIKLALKGPETGSTYTVEGSSAAVAAFGDASAGFSLGLGKFLRIGARYHYLVGAVYMDAAASGSATLADGGDPLVDGELRVDLRSTTGEGIRGYGYAYDVGVLIQPTEHLAFGLAVLDVGAIQWEDVVAETYRVQFGPELEFERIATGEAQTLEWRLPVTYQISAGYRLTPTLRVGAAYSRTVYHAADGGEAETAERAEAMLNWTGLGVLPIGIGASYDAESGLSVAGEAALKLGPLQTRLRLTDVQALFNGGEVKTLGFMLDLGFVF